MMKQYIRYPERNHNCITVYHFGKLEDGSAIATDSTENPEKRSGPTLQC